MLASAARLILGQLGLDTPVTTPEAPTEPAHRPGHRRLGSDWPRLVAPGSTAVRRCLFDDRWASAREDLAKLWLLDESEIDTDWPRLSERFEGAGHVVGTQATWWQGKALAAGRNVHASLYGRAAAAAENPGKGRYTDEIAVVTGASKGSIAASVVARFSTAVRRSSRPRPKLDDDRLAFYRTPVPRQRPLRREAVGGTRQYGVLHRHRRVGFVGRHPSRRKALGRSRFTSRTPRRHHCCSRSRRRGWLAICPTPGRAAEMEMKVLLWAVQRLIGGLSHIGVEHDIAARLHVVLPGSPNRGMFGGDGAYGEAKSALDAVVSRWKAESSWAQRVSLAHALIGWTKGTGLMGHNDAIVGAVEEAGVTTYTTDEIAEHAARPVWHRVSRSRRRAEPLQVDLTGGLGGRRTGSGRVGCQGTRGDDGRDSRRRRRGETNTEPSVRCRRRRGVTRPRLRRRGTTSTSTLPIWWSLSVARSSGRRLVSDALRDGGRRRAVVAGVLELAWTTRLVKWEDDPTPGWYDTETGELVNKGELVERYHDAVVDRVRHSRVRRRWRDRPRSRLAALGFGVPRQGLHVRGVVGGRGQAVRGVRP